MTLFYYIAANRELPLGAFGQNKTVMTVMEYITNVNPAAKEQMNMQFLLQKYPKGDVLMDIYETEEDAAGIYVSGPVVERPDSRLFHNRHVYQADPNGGSYCMTDGLKQSRPASYVTGKKCVTTLFGYLSRNMEAGDTFELYGCWADNRGRFSEKPLQELTLEINLSDLIALQEFEWKDRQFIRVTKN
ncbi:hypothetical protein [Paenibacillus sp. NEAU-GSW1]|uniref:hypothetical protein n=1 Tax=Paenibacillus sp. NEAU-GSW1 TaxID=2682486 RepID=UPI0012E19104|nr:hypothetical protein [Paenibacillus sp. NEAU-GSW1]MUT65635.1 hypothetical protein [Paenibacillus sp. NEAU-GSW1]